MTPGLPSLAVFGATGVTGRLVLAAAARQGLAPVIVARDSARLRDLVESDGIDESCVRIADVHDLRSVRAALAGISHVICAVAPFTANGFVIAQASAELGLGYTDCSGETGFMLRIGDSLDSVAQASGATLCTGNGVAAFLGDVAARWIAPAKDTPGGITVLYDISGYHPTAGSVASYLSYILPEGGATLRDGRVVRFPLGAFGGTVGDFRGIHGIFPDALVISRYWRAGRIDALMKSPSAPRPVVRALAGMATTQGFKQLLAAAPWRLWLRGAEQKDRSSSATVHVEVNERSGAKRSRSVRIEHIYAGTAQVMLATILAMSRRREARPVGVRAASEMFTGFSEVLASTGLTELKVGGA